MKKLSRLTIAVSLVSIIVLTGCGTTSTPSTSGGNSSYIQPSFISSESSSAASGETKATSAQTEASGSHSAGEKATVIDPNSTTIVAFENSPYLKGMSVPTTVDACITKYGNNYTYNSGARNYVWQLEKGTVTVTHSDQWADTVTEINFSPYDYSAWMDSDNDFSKVDVTKEYTYPEICNLVGSTGTVSKLARASNFRSTYFICWYDEKGQILYVQFDEETNKTVYINVI